MHRKATQRPRQLPAAQPRSPAQSVFTLGLGSAPATVLAAPVAPRCASRASSSSGACGWAFGKAGARISQVARDGKDRHVAQFRWDSRTVWPSAGGVARKAAIGTPATSAIVKPMAMSTSLSWSTMHTAPMRLRQPCPATGRSLHFV